MSDLRYNRGTDRFERVEAYEIEAMISQISNWQGEINAKNIEIQEINNKIQDLQNLIDQRGR